MKVIKRINDNGRPAKTVVGGTLCAQRRADQIGADDCAEDANHVVRKIDGC